VQHVQPCCQLVDDQLDPRPLDGEPVDHLLVLCPGSDRHAVSTEPRLIEEGVDHLMSHGIDGRREMTLEMGATGVLPSVQDEDRPDVRVGVANCTSLGKGSVLRTNVPNGILGPENRHALGSGGHVHHPFRL